MKVLGVGALICIGVIIVLLRTGKNTSSYKENDSDTPAVKVDGAGLNVMSCEVDTIISDTAYLNVKVICNPVLFNTLVRLKKLPKF